MARDAKSLGVARNVSPGLNNSPYQMPSIESSTLLAIQTTFVAKGWTYRTAAKALAVSASHLFRVMHGTRESASLLKRIEKLPKRAARSTTNR